MPLGGGEPYPSNPYRTGSLAIRAADYYRIWDQPSSPSVGTVDLVSEFSADPTPDLFTPSPDGKYFFASTRGPIPLSGDPHSSTGSTPGLMIIRVFESGSDGRVEGLVRISNLDAAGVERADAHGIRMRMK